MIEGTMNKQGHEAKQHPCATKNRRSSITSSPLAPSQDTSGGPSWRCLGFTPHRGGSILDWWEHWRRRWHGEKRKDADTLFGLVAWEPWKERNARFFRNEAATSAQFLAKIKQIADLWIEAGARHLGELVRE